MLTVEEIESVADRLDRAANTRNPVPPLSAWRPGLSLDDAYAIQEALSARGTALGRRKIGFKLGLTTEATQRALGVDRPIYGVLFEDGEMSAGGLLRLERLIAPRAEPELAFVMRAPLEGECTPAEALAAIDYAAPAIEIIDNRVAAKDAETGISRDARDIVADAGGAARFVISDRHFDPREVDLAAIEVTLSVGGETETGRFATVFGSPENALVELARELARRGGAIAAGDTVLTGSPLKPAPLVAAARVTADFGAFGTIGLAVE